MNESDYIIIIYFLIFFKRKSWQTKYALMRIIAFPTTIYESTQREGNNCNMKTAAKLSGWCKIWGDLFFPLKL